MKIILPILIVLTLLGGYAFYGADRGNSGVPKADVTATVPNSDVQNTATTTAGIKEFMMTSWMDKTADGKMSPHFSLSEMKVKKGDTVKITITNTAGTHDFTLDEFGIRKDTPLNQPVTVEFVADKAGTFEYYCSKYNHRQLGQRGNLIVE
ncbi:MAG: cupredoxin domain-containing protein [bacterium]|nr:cupredoxin domain-containing protein [bacterium]